MCRTPGGHRKIPDFILLLPPYETIFALLPFPYSAPYSCAVSVSVFCSLPYFGRTPQLSRHLSPTLARAQPPHDVRFPTRTQHLLLNLHDVHYHASPEEPNHAARLKQRTLRRIVCFPLWLVVQGLRRRGVGTIRGGYPSVGQKTTPKKLYNPAHWLWTLLPSSQSRYW